MKKKAALVLGMAITFSQVAMAEEIISSTEQIEIVHLKLLCRKRIFRKQSYRVM